MTDEEEAAWVAVLEAANAHYIRKMRAAIRREFAVCADDFEALRWDESAHAQRVEEITIRHYLMTAERFLGYAREMLAGAKAKRETAFGDRVATLIRYYGPERARRFAKKTNARITRTLAEAAEQGLGERETARAIRRELTASRVSLARARTIARTEIGAAQNAAMLQAAEETVGRTRLKWVAILDGRARATHADADGQTIWHGQKFKVGAAELEHPGDPKGPGEEVINCRCTMLLSLG